MNVIRNCLIEGKGLSQHNAYLSVCLEKTTTCILLSQHNASIIYSIIIYDFRVVFFLFYK